MGYTFVLLIVLLTHVTGQNFAFFGLNYQYVPDGGYACSNTIECHEYFETYKNMKNIMWFCMYPSEFNNECIFNQTIDDDVSYISFCVNVTRDGDMHNIVANTIQANDFLDSVNNQCKNLVNYNVSVFCLNYK